MSPPPPPDNHAANADAKAETAPKRKPWSAPTVRIMEMAFTTSGYNVRTSPEWYEGQPVLNPQTGPTYRTS